MHSLTQRQLDRLEIRMDQLDPAVRAFVESVSRTYDELETERDNSNRALKAGQSELARAEAKYRNLVERLPAVVYICEAGAECNCVYVSPQLRSMLGFSPDEWINDRSFWINRIHPDDRAHALAEEQRGLRNGVMHCEYRMIHRTGRVVYVRDEAVIVESSEGTLLHGALYDITDRHQALEALRESEQRFRAMADTAPVLVWGTDVQGKFTFFNKRWLEFHGRTEGQELQHNWLDSVHEEDVRHVIDIFDSGVEKREDFNVEFRMRRHDGANRWMMCTGVPRFSPGRIFAGYIGTCIDITDRKVAEEQLLHDAFYDALTGLPNRALFVDRLERALARQQRNKEYSFAVMFADMDRFKIINDSLGHVIGDQLLVAFAQRLQACLRPGDTIARLGGDEFIILLDDVKQPETAVAVAERIHQLLKGPFSLGHEIFTTASIGIAMSSGQYRKADDLLRDADTAMYRAKAQGYGRHQLFDAEMHARAVKLLHLENDLRRAVERNEFLVAYQPIVSLRTGRIMRFESLVRWKHPERGMVSPAEFIAVAEETGLIVPIGKLMMEESIRQIREWRRQCPHLPWLAVNVNLSAKQFCQPDLVEEIQQILLKHQLDPRHLGVEITESALMAEPEAAKTMLGKLRAMGVSIYLDDFGTGYSSLGYLQQFPVDGLKIDRSFVSSKNADPDSRIVHTIITMAHDLGLPVTAEGIETTTQAERLLRLNCEYGQGYLFAKPLDALAAEKMLVNRPILENAPHIEEVDILPAAS